MTSDSSDKASGLGGFLRRIFGGASAGEPSTPPPPASISPKRAAAPEPKPPSEPKAEPKAEPKPLSPLKSSNPQTPAPPSAPKVEITSKLPEATAPEAEVSKEEPREQLKEEPQKETIGKEAPPAPPKAVSEGSVAPPPRGVPADRGPGVRAFAPVLERLLMQGVSPEIARALVAEAVKVTPPTERRSPRDAYLAVAEVLRQRIPVSGPLRVRRDRASIVGVVGPTGVGKSTTLAKLAAIAALKDHKTVALITTDTYRIAATEQLKIYGRLLSLPVTVARGREELEKAIERYKSRDLILLDTAGHSPRDLPKLQDLGSMLGKESPRLESTPVVRLLVISATTKSADVQNILTQFGAVGFDGLIFTKIDESKTHGTLLNAAVWSRRPLTYFASGQAVPQDIEVATPERLVSLLLPLDMAPEA